MNTSPPILSVECNEPEGVILRHVYPVKLSFEKIKYLWDRLKEFDTLFNDFIRGDFEEFLAQFIVQTGPESFEPTGLIWEVDDIGIFFLNDIRPAVSASAHFTFWDRRFHGRDELCRKMVEFVFERYKLNRLEVQIGLYAMTTLGAMEKIGFKKEGRLREAVLYKDRWYDVNIYSVIRRELDSFLGKKVSDPKVKEA